MSYHIPPVRLRRTPSPATLPRQFAYPAQSALSISAISSTEPLSQSALHHTSPQPPQHSDPLSPKPIPPEKLEKAATLYKKFLLAEKNAAQVSREHYGFHLNVPEGPSTASVTSRGSPTQGTYQTATSSNYEAANSVLSFDDAQSSHSVNHGELTSFSGQPVREHRRNKLSSPQRERAALIRYLGACKPCHDRRVTCPLEHHDMEPLRQKHTADSPPRLSVQRQSQSSQDNSSQGKASNAPFMQRAVSNSMHTNLIGLGDDVPQTLPMPSYDTTLDIPTPTGPSSTTHVEDPQPPSFIYGAANATTLGDPYGIFSVGNMFPLGVRVGNFFQCQCLYVCNHLCTDEEALYDHFERAHFAFNRISPSLRYVCSTPNCFKFHDHPANFCSQCLAQGSIQQWIFAAYIRTPSFRRHGPEGGDLTSPFDSSTSYSALYTSGNSNSQFGSNIDGGLDDGNFGGNLTPNTYGAHGFDNYRGPSLHNYAYDPFTSPGGSSHQNQHANLMYAKSLMSRITLLKPRRNDTRVLVMILLFILLVISAFGYTNDHFVDQARTSLQNVKAHALSNLPMLGALGIVTSFATSLFVKHWSTRWLRRSRRCPLYMLTRYPGCYMPSNDAHERYPRGGLYC